MKVSFEKKHLPLDDYALKNLLDVHRASKKRQAIVAERIQCTNAFELLNMPLSSR